MTCAGAAIGGGFDDGTHCSWDLKKPNNTNRLVDLSERIHLHGAKCTMELIGVFPEGYTEVEHLPEPWKIVFPGESAPRSRATVETRIEEGRLHVTFIEEHLPFISAMFTKDWLGFFRDWNRRTGSRLIRTIVVRKGKR